MKLSTFLKAALLAVVQSTFAATGSWNGVAFTAWDGVAITAWNGTGIAAGGSSPISHRATAVGNATNSTTSQTLTIPASVATNDGLFLAFTSSGHAVGTAQPTVTDDDSGGNTWVKIANSLDRKAQLWWKRATSASASKTVTISGAVTSVASVLDALQNMSTESTPYGNVLIETNASGDETHAGFTPSRNSAMTVLSVWNYANDNLSSSQSQATGGAMSEVGDHLDDPTGSNNDCACSTALLVQSGAAAATGSITWAQTNGTTYSVAYAVWPAGSSGSTVWTDDFNRSNGDLTGNNWEKVTGHSVLGIASNVINQFDSPSLAAAYWTPMTPTADHYSKAAITTESGQDPGEGYGVICRVSDSADTYYRAVVNGDGEVALMKRVAGTPTTIWNDRTVTYSAGQVLELRCTGTTLQVFYNGSQVGADSTDSSITSGRVGIAYAPQILTGSIDNWEGGNL